jgi:non-canonical purine NTP pyrophosphatase (RdgB/HAM1 family)
MKTITLVTGNPGKLAEMKRLIPSSVQLEHADIDLDEIQSMDLAAIVKDKAQRAYEHVNSPVIVEDVSAGLDKLGGLPGPFIKYFEVEMGRDALLQLAGKEGETASAICTICYYDGENFTIVQGETKGTIVAPRGENGFGFDQVFLPDGSTKTYGEMAPAEKNIVSHRGKALRELVRQLNL